MALYNLETKLGILLWILFRNVSFIEPYSCQFRFADKTDVFLMVFGTLMAACNGAAMPVAIIFFGGMTDVFIDDAWLENQLEAMAEAAKALCYNLTELCDMNITAACNPPLFPDDCENVTSDFVKDNLWLVLKHKNNSI